MIIGRELLVVIAKKQKSPEWIILTLMGVGEVGVKEWSVKELLVVQGIIELLKIGMTRDFGD